MSGNRPNILFLMSDQMSALALPMYRDSAAKAPNLAALAARGTLFETAYCAFPLCAPARFAMMAGQLPSRIGSYDNGAELLSSTPTFVHYLRQLGYTTSAAGKLHYVGPDQLHGFEERLTTDIYPADFGWTAEWEPLLPDGERKGSGVSGAETVVDAGPYARSMQIDYDEEVFSRGLQRIYDLARQDDGRPFFLMISFTQPHDPYITTRDFWDLYQDGDVPAPTVGPIALEDLDPHSRELHHHYGIDRAPVSSEATQRARRAYFGMISDIDAKIGRLLSALEETGLSQNTAVIYTSDHGDMMGERGLWFKKTFYEWAVRVPLIITLPGRGLARRVSRAVSQLDLLPTLVELAGGGRDLIVGRCDGTSLLADVADNGGERDLVLCEHLSDGTRAPRFMIRQGHYKFVWSEAYPVQLYDLKEDPDELENLTNSPSHRGERESFERLLAETWEPERLHQDVLLSQKQRALVHAALSKGRWQPWDHEPTYEAFDRFVRHRDSFPDVERRGYLPYQSN